MLLFSTVRSDRDGLDEALTTVPTTMRNCPKHRPVLPILPGNGTRIEGHPDYYADYLRYQFCMPPCEEDPDCKLNMEY
jgi:hypothetical protein